MVTDDEAPSEVKRPAVNSTSGGCRRALNRDFAAATADTTASVAPNAVASCAYVASAVDIVPASSVRNKHNLHIKTGFSSKRVLQKPPKVSVISAPLYQCSSTLV